MADDLKVFVFGIMGTITTFSIGQWNVILGILCGILTVVGLFPRALRALRELPLILRGRHQILLLDDDVAFSEVFTRLCELAGVRVIACTPGNIYDRLERDKPALIVLDVNLPGGPDGVETFARIRRIRPTQPVCILSGYLDDATRQRIHAIGYATVISKTESLTDAFLRQILRQNGLRVRGSEERAAA